MAPPIYSLFLIALLLNFCNTGITEFLGKSSRFIPARAFFLCWHGTCNDPQYPQLDETAKRTPFYSFGLGKRDYYDEENNDDEDATVSETTNERADEAAQESRSKRSEHKFSFGLGKRFWNDGGDKRTSPGGIRKEEYRRFSFGLGKRAHDVRKREIDPSSEQQQDLEENNNEPDDALTADLEHVDEKRGGKNYAFGLGKRDRSYAFGLGKRDRSYAFGLGKRDRMYGFGLGKRPDRFYGFGLGKRDRSYAFGLGKRDRSYAFGLGKRDKMYGFGLGKREDEVADESAVSQHERQARKLPSLYAFGLGKREIDDVNNKSPIATSLPTSHTSSEESSNNPGSMEHHQHQQ